MQKKLKFEIEAQKWCVIAERSRKNCTFSGIGAIHLIYFFELFAQTVCFSIKKAVVYLKNKRFLLTFLQFDTILAKSKNRKTFSRFA